MNWTAEHYAVMAAALADQDRFMDQAGGHVGYWRNIEDPARVEKLEAAPAGLAEVCWS